MTMEKALVLLFKYYEQAKADDAIIDPVAWALYQTWKEAEHERV